MAAIQSPNPTALPDLWGQIGSVLRNALKEDLKSLTGNTAMAISILDLVDARFGELATSEPARRLVGDRFARHLSSSSSVLDVSLTSNTASLRRHFGRATLEEQQEEDTDHDTSVVLDSTTASVRRHLNGVALDDDVDDEQEEEDIEEHHSAVLDTSVFPAAPPSPAARPDNVIVEGNLVEMREPSLAPLDASMVSAAGRLSPVHPDEVIVEQEDTTMHEPSGALLDATMLSLAGRLSPLHSADDRDESMRQASVTPLAAREDKDEPMPLARHYIKAHRRLVTRAKKPKEAEPMDLEEQTPPSPRVAEVVVPVAGAAHAAQPVPTDDDEEPKEAEDLEDREGEAEDPTGEAEDAAEEAVDPEGEAVDAAEEAVDPKGEVVDPEDPEVEPQELEMEAEVQPLVAPPSPQPPRRIATAVHRLTLTRAAAMLAPIVQPAPSVHGRSPDHDRPSDIEAHACSPLKRARLTIAALEHELEEARERETQERRAAVRNGLLLQDEWAARAGARADTYRLADEVTTLEADLVAEKARTLQAQQAAVAIAAAAAVARAMQPVQPVQQPAAAVPAAAVAAAVAAPAAPATFAADMAAIKTRLLAYLCAPGNQVKINGVANARLSTAWHSLTTTAGKRLKELRDAASTGAARLTAATIADAAHTQQLTEFKDEAERMCDEYDALLSRVEAYGRQIVAEHLATRRIVRWTKAGYGDEYDAIKAMANGNLRTLRGFRESCKALPLPL